MAAYSVFVAILRDTRPSASFPRMRDLFAPHRDRRGPLHHRPLVLVDVDDGVAVRRAALPRGAEAVLGEFPRPLAFRARLVLRLADHFAVGGKRQLELG